MGLQFYDTRKRLSQILHSKLRVKVKDYSPNS